jgi:hypothetical protein
LWNGRIAEARQALLDDIEDSPSLRRHLEENLQKLYRRAMETALIEARLDYSPFPNERPWDLDTLLAD